MPSTAKESAVELPAQSWISHLRRPAILLAILCGLTFVLYYSTLSFEFVWDDHPQIVNNPLIRSWHTVARAFTSDLWFHTHRDQVYYRPLFICWSILNYALFGLKPSGWHLGAVLLHVLAVVAVYFLARKLQLDYWTAALAALLFAVHPVHIECVAWVSAASDTLVTIFYVLAFIAFLNARARDRKHAVLWRLLSFVLLVAALFTKEMAVTFAVTVGAYVLLFPTETEGGFWRRVRSAFAAAWPYVVLTVGYLLLRRAALHRIAGDLDLAHTVRDMVLTWPLVLVHYARLLVFPAGLTGLYYTPYVTGAAEVFVPLLTLLALAALIFYWARRQRDPMIIFAALWIGIGLIPVLNLRGFSNGDFVRDRYIFLSSVGFVLLLAKALRLLPKIRSVSQTAVQGMAVGALAFAFAIGCISQQMWWANEVLAFYRGHTLYPDNVQATVDYANAVGRRGAHEQAISLLTDAIAQYPGYGPAYYVLTDNYLAMGNKEQGRHALAMALQTAPVYVQSEIGQASLAGFLAQLGDYNRAQQICTDILRREPDLFVALYNCGTMQFKAGQDAEAERLLTHGIEVAPDQAGAYYYLGRVFLRDHKSAQAESAFRRAVALSPAGYEFHFWLGQCLEVKGDLAGARNEYTEALRLNPQYDEAKARLAALGP
jgi:tetratricopeptide (TPR) repeat protein